MNKKYSLKSKSDIDSLFTNGKSIVNDCILMKFENSTETKFLFTVSTKKFKRANKRNRIKRLMRESVSKYKDLIINKNVAFVFISTELKTQIEVDNAINKCISSIK